MTELLKQAFETLERMPAEMQDDIARALLGMAEAGVPDGIDPEHLAAVTDGLAQAEAGRFASGDADDIVTDAFRRHRR